jgi:hypothetical protein
MYNISRLDESDLQYFTNKYTVFVFTQLCYIKTLNGLDFFGVWDIQPEKRGLPSVNSWKSAIPVFRQ